MKNFINYRSRSIFLFSLLILVSMFGFTDNNNLRFQRLNDKVIIREDGAMYQVGRINLMFKADIGQTGESVFNIASIDNILGKYQPVKVSKRFPLTQQALENHPESNNLTRIYTIEYKSGIDPTILSQFILEANKDILEWCEPDFVFLMDYIPNDPSISLQWHLSKINTYQAWDINQGDTTVSVGIVDSGSDLDHPDLAANIKYNYADPVNGIDDDGNGYVDDFMGWDFYYFDNDPNIVGSGSTHGSHVSGCASQVTNNNIHGGGPGFKVKLRITKHAPDEPSNLIYNGYDGITYMYMNNVKIINCSWGGSYSSLGETIVTNAWNSGSMVVASAGNQESNEPRYPASYTYGFNVAATQPNDTKASFSNWHSTVDVSAPGTAILSTVFNNGYTSFQGTSMSSPIAAGTIALYKSRYPSYTNQQLTNLAIQAVDSIDHLNPSFMGGLGSGRMNAFKGLSDKAIIALVSYTHNDSVYGNNDKVYEPNEKIPIILTYKNTWVAGNNISLRLTTADTNVIIEKDSIFVGNLAAYTTYTTNVANTFEVKVKPTSPYDKTVTFRLVSSNSAYADNNAPAIVITFRQGWATHNINNLHLSLTKDGAVGKKVELYGSGLHLNSYPSVNHLPEGSLMIGISNTQVSDAARKGVPPPPYNKSDTDFTALMPYTLSSPGSYSNQDGFGMFNDDGAGATKIGVTVNARSYAWNTAGDQDFIILRYTVRNTSGAAINGMRVGMFTLFNPRGATYNNMTDLDQTNRVGYTFHQDTANPYLGVALLSNHTLSFKGMEASVVQNGFTPTEKWESLSSGISTPSVGPGNNAFTISAGPFNLAANDSVIVGFAVVKGNNLTELQNATIRANQKWGPIGIEPISGLIPNRYELFQNYPNPFNPVTTIKFSIPKQDYVKISVFDILGRERTMLTNQKLDAGVYEIPFNAGSLSSGVYFYRLETSSYTDVKKMILVK